MGSRYAREDKQKGIFGGAVPVPFRHKRDEPPLGFMKRRDDGRGGQEARRAQDAVRNTWEILQRGLRC